MADPISCGVNLPNDEDTVDSSRDEEQDALRKFIEQYELSPELWNPTNPMYARKNARNSALDRLIPLLVKFKPDANKREDVKKKINSLRTNYRKEIKKIAASKRSGKSPDELYSPSSWVFFALSFLERFEKPVQHQRPVATLQESEEQDDFDRPDITENVQQTRDTASPSSMNVQTTRDTASTSSLDPPTFPQTRTTKKKRTQGPLAKQNMLLEKACSLLETSNPDDNIPAITKVWGEKLLTLDSRQRLYAEKAINDVLFEASLGTLHRNSVSINVEQGPNITKSNSVNSSFSTFSYSSSPTYTPPPVRDQSREVNQTFDESLTTLFSNFQG